MNPQINISSLDFDEIKASLKSYLQNSNTEELNSYNYEGSAINLLLNVFSYNTLYYAFYANMIANEMFLDTAQMENNFVSLLKPLGVLLPGASCSVGEVTATSPTSTQTTITSYSDYFIGTTNTGSVYRFYTIGDDITLNTTAKTFKVYEGSAIAKDLPVSVDQTSQKAFIGGTQIDINTLTVKVTTNGVTETWTSYNNTAAVGPDAKVYFIDRTSEGFYLLFGKRSINDFANNYGKTINPTDIVTVSYIITNGDLANKTSAFNSNAKATVTSTKISSGGRATPDLDLYRYSAPKIFAANDRAITKDDYIGLLFSSQLLPASIVESKQINVWGGEDAEPKSYGRVFISFADETLTPNNYAVKNSISYIKKKSAVSILPEYFQPQIITANIDLRITGMPSTTNSTNIKNTVNTYYNNPYEFNVTLITGEIVNLLLQTYPTISGVSTNSITLKLEVYGSITDRNLYYQTEILSGFVKSDNITYLGNTVYLLDTPTKYDPDTQEAVEGNISAYKVSDSSLVSGVLGKVQYKSGIVTIYGNVLSETVKTGITVKPKNQSVLVFKNEMLLKANTTIDGL